MNWNDLSLSALKTFVDAIESGSLTLAAQKNHISRPAVSQAIRRIEQIIGYDLLEHAKNQMILTQKGRIFFQNAKTSLDFVARTLSDPHPITNEVTIACSAALMEIVVLPALKKLERHSFKRIRILVGTTSKVRQLVTDSEANLGILIDDGDTIGLESYPILEGRFRLRSPSGRLQEPLITTEARPEVLHLEKALQKLGKKDLQRIQIESWSGCHKAARILNGTCLVPDFFPLDSLKNVEKIKLSASFQIKAIARKKNGLLPAENELLRILESSQPRSF